MATSAKPAIRTDATDSGRIETDPPKHKRQDSRFCPCSCSARNVIAYLVTFGSLAYVWKDWIAQQLPSAATEKMAALCECAPPLVEALGNFTQSAQEHIHTGLSDIKEGNVTSGNSLAVLSSALLIGGLVTYVALRCMCPSKNVAAGKKLDSKMA